MFPDDVVLPACFFCSSKSRFSQAESPPLRLNMHTFVGDVGWLWYVGGHPFHLAEVFARTFAHLVPGAGGCKVGQQGHRVFQHGISHEKKIKGPEIERFVRTVSTRFESKYNTPFSVRLVENIFCKAYRELARLRTISGSIERAVDMIGNANNVDANQRFCDLLVPGQLVFRSTKLGLIVIYPDGTPLMLDSGSIFERMPFGNDLLTMEEIAKRMNLDTATIPSDTRMMSMSFDARSTR